MLRACASGLSISLSSPSRRSMESSHPAQDTVTDWGVRLLEEISSCMSMERLPAAAGRAACANGNGYGNGGTLWPELAIGAADCGGAGGSTPGAAWAASSAACPFAPAGAGERGRGWRAWRSIRSRNVSAIVGAGHGDGLSCQQPRHWMRWLKLRPPQGGHAHQLAGACVVGILSGLPHCVIGEALLRRRRRRENARAHGRGAKAPARELRPGTRATPSGTSAPARACREATVPARCQGRRTRWMAALGWGPKGELRLGGGCGCYSTKAKLWAPVLVQEEEETFTQVGRSHGVWLCGPQQERSVQQRHVGPAWGDPAGLGENQPSKKLKEAP